MKKDVIDTRVHSTAGPRLTGDKRRTQKAFLIAVISHTLALYTLFPSKKPVFYLPKQRDYITIRTIEVIRPQPKKKVVPKAKIIKKKNILKPVPIITEEPPEIVIEEEVSDIIVEEQDINEISDGEPEQSGLRHLNECDVAPQLLNDVQPIYPVAAVIQGIETRVVVEIIISKQGVVTGARIIKSSERSDFDTAALKAAKKALFSPASYRGEPVEVLMHLNVDFTLE